MDPQQVTQGLDLFNQLTQSGAGTALVFAMVLGLGFAMFVRVPAHLCIERDLLANWVCYVACIVGAFVACWWLWPEAPWRPKAAFSLSVAFATPLAWVVIVAIVKLINPKWAQALSLHRISFESPPECRNPDAPADPQP
jgi:hypothetical protein